MEEFPKDGRNYLINKWQTPLSLCAVEIPSSGDTSLPKQKLKYYTHLTKGGTNPAIPQGGAT